MKWQSQPFQYIILSLKTGLEEIWMAAWLSHRNSTEEQNQVPKEDGWPFEFHWSVLYLYIQILRLTWLHWPLITFPRYKVTHNKDAISYYRSSINTRPYSIRIALHLYMTILLVQYNLPGSCSDIAGYVSMWSEHAFFKNDY